MRRFVHPFILEIRFDRTELLSQISAVNREEKNSHFNSVWFGSVRQTLKVRKFHSNKSKKLTRDLTLKFLNFLRLCFL
jgi:hypothetical protein